MVLFVKDLTVTICSRTHDETSLKCLTKALFFDSQVNHNYVKEREGRNEKMIKDFQEKMKKKKIKTKKQKNKNKKTGNQILGAYFSFSFLFQAKHSFGRIRQYISLSINVICSASSISGIAPHPPVVIYLLFIIYYLFYYLLFI